MPKIDFNCQPTMIGSLPHTSAAEACQDVFRFLKDIPAWPQLPKRSYFERMEIQYTQGFPGLVVTDEKVFVDRKQDIDKPLEKLYAAYLENNYNAFPITADYAAGLQKFLDSANLNVKAVKGQVCGPITWGMTVTDNDQKAIAYDDVLSDACAKLLKLKAAWMENQLRQISKNTIIFVDEPYLTSFGSSFFALSREQVVTLLEEVFSGISGLKGVHCCANTDWSILLSTSMDILSFDAYGYAESLTLYPKEVKGFINRGGIISWGIVPTDEASIVKETVSSLLDRLESAMAPFTRKGCEIPFRQLVSQGMLTPSCGLARLSTESCVQAFELLNGLSEKIKSKYS